MKTYQIVIVDSVNGSRTFTYKRLSITEAIREAIQTNLGFGTISAITATTL
jgi:hypothetical protein